MIAEQQPPGKVPGGPLLWPQGPSRLPTAAGEEAEQREDQDHDQDDPKKIHSVTPFPMVVGCGGLL
jgi:hypothetical protein